MNNNMVDKENKVCSVDGCKVKHYAKSYCFKHYQRFRNNGDALLVKSNKRHHNCTIEGCNEKHVAHGYCRKHYRRWYDNGNPYEVSRDMYADYFCIFKGCKKKSRSKGYCQMHYARFRKYGDPNVVKTVQNPPEKCMIDGCSNEYHAKGMCEYHYRRSDHYRGIRAAGFQKWRANKKNSPFNDFTDNDWIECLIYFKHKCAYCDNKNEKLQKEHVVPVSRNGSNTKNNVIPACRKCNRSKSNDMLEDWYHEQSFYDNSREEKILKWMGYEIHDNKIQMHLF